MGIECYFLSASTVLFLSLFVLHQYVLSLTRGAACRVIIQTTSSKVGAKPPATGWRCSPAELLVGISIVTPMSKDRGTAHPDKGFSHVSDSTSRSKKDTKGFLEKLRSTELEIHDTLIFSR